MGSRPSSKGWTARAALAHPAWWAAATVLLVNDHYLKGAGVLAGWLTGKLSDFAGLLMAPVLVAALCAPRSRRVFWLAHVAVGAVFALLKLSPAFAEAWCSLGGALGMTWRVVSDPTDLLALPMLLVSQQLFGHVQTTSLLQAWQRLLATLGASVGLVGVVATSVPPPRAPVITPKAVLVATGSELQELNRDTGKPQRRLACTVDWTDRTMVANGVLYAGNYPGVQACDLTRGALAWKVDLGSSSQVVYADSQHVIASSRDDVWALAAADGAPRWHLELLHSQVVVSGGRLIIQNLDGNFKAVSIDDGRALPTSSELPPGVASELFGLQWQVWRVPDASEPRKPPDMVFAHQGMSCVQNRLMAFTNPGHVALWSIPWCPWGDSAVVDDTLLVTQSMAKTKLRVVARQPRTGQVLWHTLVDN